MLRVNQKPKNNTRNPVGWKTHAFAITNSPPTNSYKMARQLRGFPVEPTLNVSFSSSILPPSQPYKLLMRSDEQHNNPTNVSKETSRVLGLIYQSFVSDKSIVRFIFSELVSVAYQCMAFQRRSSQNGSCSVILYYDHCITFDDEYRYIWQNKLSGASWLFFVNRYFAFLAVRVRRTDLQSLALISCPKNIAVNVGNFVNFPSEKVSLHLQALFHCSPHCRGPSLQRNHNCVLAYAASDPSCSRYSLYRQIVLIVSQVIVCSAFVLPTLRTASASNSAFPSQPPTSNVRLVRP